MFRASGEDEYRRYQEEHLDDALPTGIAFPFIKRLLSLNDLADDPADPLVEVIVLSRNDPETGLRVMRSIAHHALPITRAVFMQGRSPHKFIPAFSMSLFLSANAEDVRDAIERGLPAGQVLTGAADDDASADLRIAFDFDGVLADDPSEAIMQSGGLDEFHAHESTHSTEAHEGGPLRELLRNINRIQDKEEERRRVDSSYEIRVHVAIVTARNAPSHERAVKSLKEWGVRVNDAFFLGGIDKGRILQVLQPHIFFDDQRSHLDRTASVAPSVHVPFGAINRAATSG